MTPRLVVWALLLFGCERERYCKPGTLLVDVTLTGAAVGAGSLEVITTVDGRSVTRSVNHTAGSVRGTIEVDFTTYPVGRPVMVTVNATGPGGVVGSGNNSKLVAAGCDRLSLVVGVVDGGMDAAGGAVVLRQGQVGTLGAPQTVAGYVLKEDGFELQGRSCVGALCCTGGITP